MLTENQRQFLMDNRFCVVGWGRKAGPPAMSPVYYVMDGDDLLITTQTTKDKGKVFANERDRSVCVMAENHPSPRYMTIYGKAKTETDGAVDLLMRIVEVFSGNPLPEAARPGMEAKAQVEGRVVLRVTPASVVGQV
jgi:nitroimidazol reductase NimA-like FMN-containing flavoprotein (pyridoxamine 5'-phosphate oxidase superfamily)